MRTSIHRLLSQLLAKNSQLQHLQLLVDMPFLRCYGDASEDKSQDADRLPSNGNLRHLEVIVKHRQASINNAANKVNSSRSCRVGEFLDFVCKSLLGDDSQVHSLALRGCLLNRDVAAVLGRHVTAMKSLQRVLVAPLADTSVTGQTASLLDCCSSGCVEMAGVNSFSEMLRNVRCDLVQLELDAYAGPGSNSGSSTDYEIVVASVLKALQRNNNLQQLQFRCRNIPHSVLETLADTVERCAALQTVVIHTEKLHDLLADKLANAVMCQASLRTLRLISSRFEAFSPNALMTLLQASVYSPLLSSLEIRYDDWSPVTNAVTNTGCTTNVGLPVRLVEAALRCAEQFAVVTNEISGQLPGDQAVTNDGDQAPTEVTVPEEEEEEEEEEVSLGEVVVRKADCPLVVTFAGSLSIESAKLGKRKPEETLQSLKQNAAQLTQSVVRVQLDLLRL